MREIDVFEATNRLGQLLDLVGRGEEVVITRHGKPIARLMPPRTAVNRAEAREAAQQIREMSNGVTLGGIPIKDLIDTGRK